MIKVVHVHSHCFRVTFTAKEVQAINDIKKNWSLDFDEVLQIIIGRGLSQSTGNLPEKRSGNELEG